MLEDADPVVDAHELAVRHPPVDGRKDAVAVSLEGPREPGEGLQATASCPAKPGIEVIRCASRRAGVEGAQLLLEQVPSRDRPSSIQTGVPVAWLTTTLSYLWPLR